jgi:hypothetical protein
MERDMYYYRVLARDEAISRNEWFVLHGFTAALVPSLPFFLLAAKERNKEKLSGIKDCLMPDCYLDAAALLLCCQAKQYYLLLSWRGYVVSPL